MIEFFFEATIPEAREADFLAIDPDLVEIIDQDDDGLICCGTINSDALLKSFIEFFEKDKTSLDRVYFHCIHAETFKAMHPSDADEDEMLVYINDEEDFDLFIKKVL